MSSSATKLSALALVPDVAAWPAIQALRSAHDKQVRVWPPRINLLYPFLSEAELELAAKQLATVTQQLGPLKLKFQRKGRFGSTAFLVPECPEDPGLARLHSLCASVFPDVKRPGRAYVPHLTIGQFKSEADCQAFLESSPAVAIEADVSYLSLLARTETQQPFRTAWRVELGENLAVAVEQGSPQPYTFRAAGTCQADRAEEKQAEWKERKNKHEDWARRVDMKTKKETEEKAKLEVKEKATNKAEEKANKNELQDVARKKAAEYNQTMPDWEVPMLLRLTQAEETAHKRKLQDVVRKVAKYNKTMPGWEVPMLLQSTAALGATVDDAEGSKVVGAPQRQQEVSSQPAAESNALGSEKVPELSWATRLLLQESPSPPVSRKVRIVSNQLITTRLHRTSAPDVKQVQKPVNQHQRHSAQLRKNLPQCHIRVKNCRKHPLKMSTEIHPTFIKLDVVSKPKTDPTTWPAVRSGEIEFMLDSPLSISPTRSVCSPSSLAVGNFTFKILVFPRGTHRAAGKHLSAFVLAEPGDVEPDCVFKNVKYEITLVNWTDFTQSEVKSDTFSFKASGPSIDRGWHDLMTVDKMAKSDSEWVGPAGSVCVRARCQVSSPGHQWSSE